MLGCCLLLLSQPSIYTFAYADHVKTLHVYKVSCCIHKINMCDAQTCELDSTLPVALLHSTAQHSTVQHSTARHGTAQHSTAQRCTARHSTAQHGTAQHSAAQRRARHHNYTGRLQTQMPSLKQHSTPDIWLEGSSITLGCSQGSRRMVDQCRP